MVRGIGILAIALLGAGLVVGAQTATVTMWTFPEPDRLPNDLVLGTQGGVFLTCFLGKTVGHLNPKTNVFTEWEVEDSPSHLVRTDEGIVYTLPILGAVGLLDPEQNATITWTLPTADGSPDTLTLADHGVGVINVYIAERNAGKIAAFEPLGIPAQLPRIALPDLIPITPTTSTEEASVQVVSPTVILGPRPFLPIAAYSTPSVQAPFKEWTPPVFGYDLYIDDVSLGPDGGIWFTQGFGPFLGVLVPWDNVLALYMLPEIVEAVTVTTGPNESIWFADVGETSKIGRLHPMTGTVELWEVPGGDQPFAFTFDAQERVWFSDRQSNRMYRFDPGTNTFTWWQLPSDTRPLSIDVSADGEIWFVSEGRNGVGRLNVGSE